MYHRTLLPNGVRVVSEYLPYVRSISLGVWFETGSRDELPEERGLAHFIETWCSKAQSVTRHGIWPRSWTNAAGTSTRSPVRNTPAISRASLTRISPPLLTCSIRCWLIRSSMREEIAKEQGLYSRS